ncbi:MAG: EAL domain-containing protein [Lachnospiraceae bacterium]|nr:EAL domain-containing protein [Lachnospiraceae bacterium]
MSAMPYNFHYETSAALILVVMLIVIFCKKRLYIQVNNLFVLHLFFMIVDNYLGMVCGMVNTGIISASLTAKNILNAMDGGMNFITMTNYLLYLLSLAHLADWKKWYIRMGVLPLCILGITAVVVPFYGQVSWVTASGDYTKGVAFWVAGAIVFIYIAVVTVSVIKFGAALSMKHRVFLAILNVMVVGSFFVQEIVQPNFRVLYPVFTFMLFLHFMSLQSPDFYIDNMTGLYNYNAFMEVLREYVAYKKNFHCMLIRINDYDSLLRIFRYDHLTAVRKRLAEMLTDPSMKGNATVYRVGSSAYGVICTKDEQVKRLHEKCLSYLPKNWEIEDEVISTEYCYYHLEFNGENTEFDKMMQWMYYAASDHETHHPLGELIELRYDIMSETEKQREVLHLIEKAILDQSMEIFLQPVYSMDQKKITSLEVLSRMKDDNQNYINPEYFIHVAEENHRILELGELIFRRACIFASQNHIFDLGIEYMNVNISPGQCQYEYLTENFEEIAREYDIPLDKIHLEITESEVQDPEAVKRTLARLRKSGMEVALDDFGTGCSTLLSILDLPLDYVKIDKSLVWSYDSGGNRFLDDLMPVIKAEGKKVIAEGIETEEHIEIFKRLRGDYLQGYYFSKPLPEREFVHFVREFNKA